VGVEIRNFDESLNQWVGTLGWKEEADMREKKQYDQEGRRSAARRGISNQKWWRNSPGNAEGLMVNMNRMDGKK
jgi:hypothetical protein